MSRGGREPSSGQGASSHQPRAEQASTWENKVSAWTSWVSAQARAGERPNGSCSADTHSRHTAASVRSRLRSKGAGKQCREKVQSQQRQNRDCPGEKGFHSQNPYSKKRGPKLAKDPKTTLLSPPTVAAQNFLDPSNARRVTL